MQWREEGGRRLKPSARQMRFDVELCLETDSEDLPLDSMDLFHWLHQRGRVGDQDALVGNI